MDNRFVFPSILRSVPFFPNAANSSPILPALPNVAVLPIFAAEKPINFQTAINIALPGNELFPIQALKIKHLLSITLN